MKLFLLFTVFLRLTYTAHSYLGSRKEANTAYVITATAPKQIQFAQLIRLGNTLNLNNKLQWVIVSGSPLKVNVLRYMERLRIPVRVVVGMCADQLKFRLIRANFGCRFPGFYGCQFKCRSQVGPSED